MTILLTKFLFLLLMPLINVMIDVQLVIALTGNITVSKYLEHLLYLWQKKKTTHLIDTEIDSISCSENRHVFSYITKRAEDTLHQNVFSLNRAKIDLNIGKGQYFLSFTIR